MTYVNALITAVSAIYEREVDTHLHIKEVAVTASYDDITDTGVALDLMKTIHAGNARFENGIDLHHASLETDMAGGRASLAAVCGPNDGYGVSTGIADSLSDINNGQVYWNIFVFAHELGYVHNNQLSAMLSRPYPIHDTHHQHLYCHSIMYL